MYIHSYQMHNVLDVYRKQLSQETARNMSGNSKTGRAAHDRINISIDGQRQSLFDKISSEIVDRITRFGPDTDFESALAGQMAESDGMAPPEDPKMETQEAADGEADFTYTLINEQNQKVTQRLTVRQFGMPAEDMELTNQLSGDSDIYSESE